MTARLIDGKAIAAGLRGRIAALVPGFAEATGRAPGLAVVLVGDDPASHIYVRNKQVATREAAMVSFEHRLDAAISEQDLLTVVAALNADPRVDGILVQLPLPLHINDAAVLAAIDPAKDVDGFHVINAGRLATGQDALVPCTPSGCLMLLRDTLGDLSGMEAVVVGRSNIVGKPMAQLLIGESCTVTVAHSRTRDLAAVTRRADILVSAVGRPGMIRGDWIKPGATVIDVGINRIAAPDRGDGKTRPIGGAEKMRVVGDVNFDAALAVAGAITPVPGGVGPMTIACLLRNTLAAAHRRAGLDVPKGL